ncbi:MAG: sulfatase [Planctomycetes bacterium]|nr:sulfatase [Planctomycetota bacterium]
MTDTNVLFIPVDDLRPQIGCYGRSQMKTPHLDQLAGEGTLFNQAYCQVPVCGASRASLLSGRRPTRERFVDYLARVDEDLPSARTLPQHFKENGYETISVGKVFHHSTDCAERSWCAEPWRPSSNKGVGWRNYLTPEAIAVAKEEGHRGPPYECAEVPDNAYFDGRIADRAIAELESLKRSDKPFFLAAGFLKPHLPFNAPKKYWDLYGENDVNLADNPFAPEGAPEQALHNFGELRAYFDIPEEGPVPDDMARNLVHGYYACTSFVDAQIGRLLQALRENDLAKNTIVVVWGDHGWQLGEHGMWCKHCNFKTSLNAPLIFRVPDQRGGVKTDAISEFADIYPTLCELTGIDEPDNLAGVSLVSTLDDPDARVKDAAYSRWYGGESVRTENFLFTEWRDENGETEARMLYDHDSDPDENVNVAGNPENAEVVERFSGLLAENRERIAAANRSW